MARYKGEKGTAWTHFSRYIIKRDGGKCSTCHRSAPEYQMNAGHYQPVGLVGSNNMLSWDEKNVHCQCTVCNLQGQGMQETMASYIAQKYGVSQLEDIKSRVKKIDPVKDHYTWKELAKHYKELTNLLDLTK